MSGAVHSSFSAAGGSSRVFARQRESIISISSSDEDDNEIWKDFDEPDAYELDEVEQMIDTEEVLTPSRSKGKERHVIPSHSNSDLSSFSSTSTSASSGTPSTFKRQPSDTVSVGGYPTPRHYHSSRPIQAIENPFASPVPTASRGETTYSPVPLLKRQLARRPLSPESPSAKRLQRDYRHSKSPGHRSPPLRAPIFHTSLSATSLSANQVPLVRPDRAPAVPAPVPIVAEPPPEVLRRPLVSSGPLALDHYIIANDEYTQRDMDLRKVPFGVQYMLAWGVTKKLWKWDNITPSLLNKLNGTNAAAMKNFSAVMQEALTTDLTRAAMVTETGNWNKALWEEYDREEAALREGQGRGLGLKGDWMGEPNWFGGRIQQSARVHQDPVTKDCTVVLELPDMCRSHRFARFLGSRRILELSIPLGSEFDPKKQFVLCGRVYVPIDSKDKKVYLMEVNNQDYRRLSSMANGDDTRISYWDFIKWHNDPTLNFNQAISKWTARFDLGLSTSVPVLQFDPKNIFFSSDKYAPPFSAVVSEHEHKKVPTEKVMTDGCGFINNAALIQIAQRLCLSSRPVAVQGRVAGSKGLWILHPQDLDSTAPPRIWIHYSQRKITLPDLATVDRAHLIFDHVQHSTVLQPSHLSTQLIMALSHNGVPHSVFKQLLTDGLNDIVQSLTQWADPFAMQLLWNRVDKLGSVKSAQLQKLAGGVARAIGLARRRFDEPAPDDDDLMDTTADEIDIAALLQAETTDSTRPLHQAALELIQAGFHPASCANLNDKLRRILKIAIEAYIKKYHIAVPHSAEAFIVPDPFDVLEEGQIHFRSSRELKDPVLEMGLHFVKGDVLVSRNPTRVASDMRKVCAVDNPRLSEYVDVIVFSTKGSRSLASYLGGGDYDGDTATINWAEPIVTPFKNSEFVDKPASVDASFESKVIKVPDFYEQQSALPPTQAHPNLLEVLLSGLRDRKVGMYSHFHDNAVYAYGYDDPRTVYLAYMFTTCLDSNKSGLRLRTASFSRDSQQFNRPKPKSMQGADKQSSDDTPHLPRAKHLKRFVLDSLNAHGSRLLDEHLTRYQHMGTSLDSKDEDLCRPYLEVCEMVAVGPSDSDGVKMTKQVLAEELRAIREHVDKMKGEWGNVGGSDASATYTSKSPTKRSTKSTSTNNVKMLAKKFAAGPPSNSVMFFSSRVAEVRASYAYSGTGMTDTFAFAMAFEELCQIKAKAKGGTAAATHSFASLMSMPGSAVRVLGSLPTAADLEML